MNKNTQKATTKSNNIVRSCQKHSKYLLKSTDKSNNQQSHTASIKCHEEVICNRPMAVTYSCKPEYFSCEPEVPFYKKDSKNTKKSKKKENKNTFKYSTSKPKMCCESTNKQIYTDAIHHLPQSKSAPVVQISNLEDSVDFIPVKLSEMDNGCKIQSPKDEPKSTSSEKTYKNRGPTWDQLLKNGNKIFHSDVKYKSGSDKDHYPQNYNKANICGNSKSELLKGNIDASYKNSVKSGDVMSDNNYIYDVIKTLHQLIKKQREMILNQPQNDNMNKIIVDIDNALLKIFPQDQPKTESEIGTSTTLSNVATSLPPQPETKQITIAEWDIPLLKKNLEESCLFLQSLCIKQRENCNNHVREKEQLSIQLAESRRLVATARSKEKEYEKTIGELRLRLQETNSIKDQHSKSLQELKTQLANLQAKNDALESLNVHMKECSAEKEMLQSKLYLKDLEIEKLKILLEVKPTNSASTNKQKFEEGLIVDELKLDIPEDDKATLLSMTSDTSLNLCGPRIICSSQASSSPRRSPSPYDSWQHISSIPPDLTEINELHNSMVRVLNIMKTDTEWCDTLQLELEEPLEPSFYNECDKINQKEANLECGNIKPLSS